MSDDFDRVSARLGVFSPEQLELIQDVLDEICAENQIAPTDIRREALAIALTFPEHATSDKQLLKASGLRAISFN